MAVNEELILLYWEIGHDILDRQDSAGWGAKIVDRLSADLKHDFPEMTGFSPRNLKHMRALAEALPNREIVQQVIAQLPCLVIAARQLALEFEVAAFRNLIVYQPLQGGLVDRIDGLFDHGRAVLLGSNGLAMDR